MSFLSTAVQGVLEQGPFCAVATTTPRGPHCTPLVFADERPASHWWSTEIDSVPSTLQASFQERPLAGVSLTCTRPLVATSDAAGTPSVGATFSKSASSALPEVRRMAGIADAAVVLPPELPLNG